jgi:TolA-binding protein
MTSRALITVGLLSLAGPAHADQVDDGAAKVAELQGRMDELDRKLKPPEEPPAQLAERRLIDAEVAYELKNYEAASIILYDVIEKYPSSRVYPEALYFLSDSLFLKRDYFSSRRFFEKLVELGPSSGKYQEALQRLVELSLHTGDYAPVDSYLAKLSQLPINEQMPSVPYVKGKYHYFRQQYPECITTLRALPPNHKYYLYGLYFIGAAQVAQGPEHMQEGLVAFDTIAKAGELPLGKDGKPDPKQPSKLNDAEKLIVELAHMARARLLLDQGQLTAAMEAYAKIGTKSANFNDALYESAWVSIKGKEYDRAAKKLDLLLLNAPESVLAPETRLLTGNLYIRQGRYNDATGSFTKSRDDYEPVSKQLQAEAQKQSDGSNYFRDLIAKNLSKFDIAKVVPEVAVRWMKEEPSVKKLDALLTDESDLDKSLADAQDTIRRLERACNGPGRVNIFPDLARARAKGVEISTALTEVRKSLAERERKLIEPVAQAEAGQLKQVSDERTAIEQQLAQLPSQMDSIFDRQKKAREAMNNLDKSANEAQIVLNGTRAQVVATRKYYKDAIEKTLPPDQQRAAQAEIDSYVTEMENEQAAIDATRKELDEAMSTIGIDDSDMKAGEELKAKYTEVLTRQHAIVMRISSRLGGGDRTKIEQIENVFSRARAIEDKIGTYNKRIDALVEEKLGPIRATIDEEKNKIAMYKQTLGGYEGESADVGGNVLAEGLKIVAMRFYNIVVRSDVGIIDVAWALKDSSTKETNRLVSERKRELKLLDDEFKEVLKDTR